MATSSADSWDGVRQAFAEQFEEHTTYFVYRHSLKGKAIRVTAEERRNFIEQFDRYLLRLKWLTYAGLALILGSIVAYSLLRGGDLASPAIFAGTAVVMIPYVALYRWAWAAPSRALAGRTPIAGERNPEEVRRLSIQRMSYGQLGAAAVAGVFIPLTAHSHQNVLSGWSRLWLIAGAALILLAVVQAIRKWRFEREDVYRDVLLRPAERHLAKQSEGSPSTKSQLRRYLPLGLLLLGLGFIAYTPTGQQLARQPSFWPILMIGLGGWSLFTVVRGSITGDIELIARGFNYNYQRETQPKRFWASITWNALLGGFCVWIGFSMSRDATAQSVRDRCSNQNNKYRPSEMLSACDQLVAGEVSTDGWSRADVLVARGVANANLGRPERAIADYSAAIRLQSNYQEAYYNRALPMSKSATSGMP